MLDIAEIQRKLNLPDADIYLIGDGSGTVLGNPSGFSCLEMGACGGSQWHYGGFSNGTNNFAELVPYLFVLWRLDYLVANNKIEKPSKIVIVSDSEMTVRCANRTHNYKRKSNLPLWAMYEWFENNGYNIEWVHILRSTIHENLMANNLSNKIRIMFKDLVLDKEYVGEAPRTDFSFSSNPDFIN